MRLLCIFLGILCMDGDVIKTSSLIQTSGIVKSEVGKNVTLECFCKNEAVTFLSWYQQGLGGKPNIISTRMKHSMDAKIYPGSSDAGMYYCALASCGEIVFGNGTRLEIVGSSTKVPPFLVYVLSVALGVSIIVLLVLALVLHKVKKTLCSICKGSVSHLTCSATADVMNRDADVLHYAALSLNKSRKQHRQEDNVHTECVYSRIRNDTSIVFLVRRMSANDNGTCDSPKTIIIHSFCVS
ncbi:hypothetical protein Q5P01_002254 [Channa striata]|uniref:Ig-like domain-containing protein n=1 Tax=Channa striata TaxID=64152 RepID=A0AA88NSF5_CHASR|nr:hypothetical protein Q5P01_002254 [Channa striata]